MLVVKTGRLKDDWFSRLPTPLTLNADPELRGMPKDPLRYLALSNVVSNPSLMADGTSWCRNCKISDVLYQVLVEMCSKSGHLVADLSALTGASYKACKVSGRHFFGMEADKRIFNALLKPLSTPPKSSPLLVGRRKT